MDPQNPNSNGQYSNPVPQPAPSYQPYFNQTVPPMPQSVCVSPAPASDGGKKLGVASLILGLIGVFISPCFGVGALIGIPALIMGCFSRSALTGKKPGTAIFGILLGILSIILSVISLIVILAFWE